MGSAVTGLALLGVLAACGTQPHPVGFQDAPPQSAPVSPTSEVPPMSGAAPPPSAPPPTGDAGSAWPAPPEGGTAIPAAQVDASALPEDYPRLVWTEGDGRTVGAYGQEGGCTFVHAELREQTTQRIRLTFVEVTTSTGPCTMDLRYRPVTVELDAVLGSRTVVLERQNS